MHSCWAMVKYVISTIKSVNALPFFTGSGIWQAFIYAMVKRCYMGIHNYMALRKILIGVPRYAWAMLGFGSLNSLRL